MEKQKADDRPKVTDSEPQENDQKQRKSRQSVTSTRSQRKHCPGRSKTKAAVIAGVAVYTFIALLITERTADVFSCGRKTNETSPSNTTSSNETKPGVTTTLPNETIAERNCKNTEEDGVKIFPSGKKLYCVKGGWTVFQRRFDGSVNFFERTWNEYKAGFGETASEFWMGLDEIHTLTSPFSCQLRLLISDNSSTGDCQYSFFSVKAEALNFVIVAKLHSGTLGDAFALRSAGDKNESPFSTSDRNNAGSNSTSCAASDRGAWWWPPRSDCPDGYLNGRYASTTAPSSWPGLKDKVLRSMMMFRCGG